MIKKLERRLVTLKQQHDVMLPLFQDVSEYILPWIGQFIQSDSRRQLTSVQTKNYRNIVDDAGTEAVQLLAAGIINDTMSPTTQWFGLAIDGDNIGLDQASKRWLDDAAKLIASVLVKSNVYQVCQSVIEVVAAFGTACAFIDDDNENIIRLHLFEPGEFYLATNSKGEVDSVYREFIMTVAQIVDAFGIENTSERVRNAFNKGDLDQEVQVRHAIEPRFDRDMNSKLAKDMPFKSVYWEYAGHNNKPLRESGFKTFPCIAPRWDVFGNSAYGHCPGFRALGTIKQLQFSQIRKSEAIDYQVRPPLTVPISMKDRNNEYYPGGMSYYDPTAGSTGGVRTAYEVKVDLNALIEDIRDARDKIKKIFHSDLFTLITDVARQSTAYEIAERKQEKVTLLGPVSRRLNLEMHTVIINTVFGRMFDAGLFPAPPDTLQGKVLKVEYKSALEDASKSQSLVAIERFLGMAANTAQINPEALDKINIDRIIDAYADGLGVDPDLAQDDEKVAMTRQARAEAQAKQAQQEQMLNMATAAGKVGNVPAEGNLLSEGMKNAGKAQLGQ